MKGKLLKNFTSSLKALKKNEFMSKYWIDITTIVINFTTFL